MCRLPKRRQHVDKVSSSAGEDNWVQQNTKNKQQQKERRISTRNIIGYQRTNKIYNRQRVPGNTNTRTLI